MSQVSKKIVLLSAVVALCAAFLCARFMSYKERSKTVFIFDFDYTISRQWSTLLAVKNAANNDKDKMDKISAIIAEESAKMTVRGPVIYLLLDKINHILGRNLNKSDFKAATDQISHNPSSGIAEAIKMIKAQGHDVMVLGGGYVTCDMVTEVASSLGIDRNNIISGVTYFADNGDSYLDRSKTGFFNCSTGQHFTTDWVKSKVIKQLKATGKIKGRVVHIGDGNNDLEVWKAKEADVYIGFGLNEISHDVKAEAPIFVETEEQFIAAIRAVLNLVQH